MYLTYLDSLGSEKSKLEKIDDDQEDETGYHEHGDGDEDSAQEQEQARGIMT